MQKPCSLRHPQLIGFGWISRNLSQIRSFDQIDIVLRKKIKGAHHILEFREFPRIWKVQDLIFCLKMGYPSIHWFIIIFIHVRCENGQNWDIYTPVSFIVPYVCLKMYEKSPPHIFINIIQ